MTFIFPRNSLNYSDSIPLFIPSDRCKRVSDRFISTTPYRILDAPGIIDDYYLNLLDWNKNGLLNISLNDTIYTYNLETKEVNEIHNLNISNNTSTTTNYIAAVASYNNNIYFTDSNGFFYSFDLFKETIYINQKISEGRISCINQKSNFIISTGNKNGIINNLDLRINGKIISNFKGHNQEICGLKWNSTGEYLASGSNDNNIKIWKLGSPINQTLKGHNSAVKAMDWCNWKCNILASGGGSKDKSIRFWDIKKGQEIKKIETESQVCGLKYINKYKEMITSHGYSSKGIQNDLKLWKTSGGIKLIKSFGSHESRVLHTAISPDESTIASLGGDESLKFWKISEKPEIKSRRESISIR